MDQTAVKDGVIENPPEYRRQVPGHVRAILPADETSAVTADMIDLLLAYPVEVHGFRPLTKEEPKIEVRLSADLCAGAPVRRQGGGGDAAGWRGAGSCECRLRRDRCADPGHTADAGEGVEGLAAKPWQFVITAYQLAGGL
jgi:hypothetical protein